MRRLLSTFLKSQLQAQSWNAEKPDHHRITKTKTNPPHNLTNRFLNDRSGRWTILFFFSFSSPNVTSVRCMLGSRKEKGQHHQGLSHTSGATVLFCIYAALPHSDRCLFTICYCCFPHLESLCRTRPFFCGWILCSAWRFVSHHVACVQAIVKNVWWKINT